MNKLGRISSLCTQWHLQHASLLLRPLTFTSLHWLVEICAHVKPLRSVQPVVSAQEVHQPDLDIKPPPHVWQPLPLYTIQPAHFQLPQGLRIFTSTINLFRFCLQPMQSASAWELNESNEIDVSKAVQTHWLQQSWELWTCDLIWVVIWE